MRTLAPLALLLSACGSVGDTGNSANDSGPLDTDPNYEEGCITVDGDGGYKYLADALKVADEGSIITLCEGTLEESVTITRSVFITAPTGADIAGVIWSAPSNQVAAAISGAGGVGFSGFSVASTRTGFNIDSASDVSFTNVDFTSIQGTAIQASDTEGLLVDSCTFLSPALGGVEVDGGTATVSNSTFDYAYGYAVKAVGGATVTLEDSTVTGTYYTELNADGGYSDGWGFWGTEDSLIISTNNVYTDNLAGLWTDEASMDSSGDQLLGGLYGAFCVLGSCTFAGDTFTDNLAYGIVAANQGDGVSITDSDISGDPAVVLDDGVNGYSVGVLIQADGLVEVTDTTITGHNYVGLLAQPWDGGLELAMTRVDMDNNGRNGLYMSDLDATLVDVNVDNLREVESGLQDNGDGSTSITHGFGVAIFGGSSVTWTGGGARDSELINILNFQSTLVADGIELAGANYFGLWNIEGDLTFKNGTVTRAPYRGAIMSQYGAALTVENTAFADSNETYLWEYDVYGDGTYVYEYYYEDYSTDVVSFYDGPVSIKDNTFNNGSNGIQINANTTDAEVIGNSWQDYNQQAVYVSSQSSSSPVVIEDNSFERVGAYAVYCSYGAAQLKDIVVAGVPGYRSAGEYYINGEFSYAYDSTYYQPGIYAYSCEMELDNVVVSDAQDHGIELRNSSLVLIDVAVSGSSAQGAGNDGSLMVSYDSSSPDLLAQGVTVSDNAVGAGLVIRGSSSYPGGTVQLSGVHVSDSAGDGIWLDTLTDTSVSLDDVTVTGNAGAGIKTSGTDLLLDDAIVHGNTGAGLDVDGSSGSPVATDLLDVLVYDNGSDGISLSWSTTSVSGLSVTGNLGYGLVCAATTTLSGCDDSDLSTNTDGPHCGCHDYCTELPGPLCPDQPDDEGGDDTSDSGGDTGP